MERWKGRVGVVTGAGAGIGAAVAAALAGACMRVVAVDRAEQRNVAEKLNKKLSGAGQIVPMYCDVGKPGEIAAAFDRIEREYGGVDLLVNNAALLRPGFITELYPTPLNDDSLEEMVDVNITGLILCTRRTVASMKRRGVDGHIININSLAGHYLPCVPAANVYPMTKHAVTAFTISLNDEIAHARARIKTTTWLIRLHRFRSISPGLVDTDMGRGVSGELNTERPPMLRAADVAAAVVYAVSTPPDVNVSELTISALHEKRI